MGIVDSCLVPRFHRPLPKHECFQRKLLLLRPPKEALLDPHLARSLSEIVVHKEYRMLRSLVLSVNVWGGEKLLPEQWQTYLVGNSAVVYFVNVQSDPDYATTCANMDTLLNHALVASQGVEVFVVTLGSPGVLDADYRRASERFKARYEVLSSAQDVFGLMQRITSKIPPLELVRPLRGLLSELSGAIEADETHIIDAASFLPMTSYFAPGRLSSTLLDTVPWRLHALCSRRDLEVNFLVFNHNRVRVFLSWICRPYAFVLVAVSDGNVGNELMHRNILQISYHISNVINNTSRVHRFVPIVESDLHAGEESS